MHAFKYPVSALVAVAGTFLFCGGAVQAATGPHRPLDIQDLVDIKGFQIQASKALVFSPDGKWLVSTVCDPAKVVSIGTDDTMVATRDAPYHSMGCDLWLYEVAGAKARNLTGGQGNNWSPSWSPDGRSIAFHSDRDGVARVWRWDRENDAVVRLSDAATRQSRAYEAPIWIEGGDGLLVKLRPEGDPAKPKDKGPDGPPSQRAPAPTVTVYVSPQPEESQAREVAAPDADRIADFGRIDVRTGAVRRIATGVNSSGHKLSPDGRHLAYLDYRRSLHGGMSWPPPYALVLLDMATGERSDLAFPVGQSFGGAWSWSPDGRRLAYVNIAPEQQVRPASSSTSREPDGGNLYLVSLDDRRPRRVSGAPENHFQSDFQPPLWDAAGKHVYLLGVDHQAWQADADAARATQISADPQRRMRIIVGDRDTRTVASDPRGARLYLSFRNTASQQDGFGAIDLAAGVFSVLVEENKVYGGIFDSPVLSPDGRHIGLLAESASQSADIWLFDLASRRMKQLSHINPQLRDFTLGSSRLIQFKSRDGVPLRAAVALPADYTPGKRYPTVLWVYASNANGGSNVNRFGLVGYPSFNMQMLTSRGYVVMWPDIPTRLGTPVRDLMSAVMPAIDRAVELGFTDPDRLAVMGNSNGGYSTLALLSQTRRFKAGVMNAGFGDLTAFHGTMGGGWIPWVERLGGSMGVPPWEAPMRYVENSPIYYLDRIETPLIIQAGSADEGIIQHSDQVWVGMQRLKKQAIYLRYGGEGHLLTGAENLKDYWKRVLAFFAEHLGSAP